MDPSLPERAQLPFEILPQPDETTCGPTCLHAIYRFYGESLPLEQVVAEVSMLEGGGTLAVLLACHALRRGYRATIYTYKLQLFDPTWFDAPGIDIAAKLEAQLAFKADPKLQVASRTYIDFLRLGGEIRSQDLSAALLRSYLTKGLPVIAGLSASWLYGSMREFGPACLDDDLRGEPAGHFVVLCGYDRAHRTARVADPLHLNPVTDTAYYDVTMDRLQTAILLGVLTYDANLLVIEPRRRGREKRHAVADRG